jgi:transcriptional regulator with XRE-family HTH domain
MTEPRSISPELSRLVARRMEEMRLKLKITQQAVAEGSRMARSSYVEKCLGSRQRFSIDQADDVANYFRRVTGRKLTAWPFIDEKTSDTLSSLLDIAGRS